MAIADHKMDAPKALPVPSGDSCQLVKLSNAEELAPCTIAVYAAMRNHKRRINPHFFLAQP